MGRTEYESSAIKSASYDFEKRELEVEFRSGGVYRYQDVPPEEAEAFAAASSKGGHFQAYIRNNYAPVKVEEEDVESFPFPEVMPVRPPAIPKDVQAAVDLLTANGWRLFDVEGQTVFPVYSSHELLGRVQMTLVPSNGGTDHISIQFNPRLS